jgi:hypothetical protein
MRFEETLGKRKFTLVKSLDPDKPEPDTINNPSFEDIKEALEAFNFEEWNYLILSPDKPFKNNVFLQVGTADRKNLDGTPVREYDLETRFVNKEINQYAMTTADKQTVLDLFQDYLNQKVLGLMVGWKDITASLDESYLVACLELTDDGVVNYKVWRDHTDKKLYVTVNFEEADDVHYTMLYSEWEKFLQHVVKSDSLADLKKYFAGKRFYDFYFAIQKLKLKFTVVDFWAGPEDERE